MHVWMNEWMNEWIWLRVTDYEWHYVREHNAQASKGPFNRNLLIDANEDKYVAVGLMECQSWI